MSDTNYSFVDALEASSTREAITARLWALGYSYATMAVILDVSVKSLKNRIRQWKVSKPTLFRTRGRQRIVPVLFAMTVPAPVGDAVEQAGVAKLGEHLEKKLPRRAFVTEMELYKIWREEIDDVGEPVSRINPGSLH